jgi:hypothetical protein
MKVSIELSGDVGEGVALVMGLSDDEGAGVTLASDGVREGVMLVMGWEGMLTTCDC